MAGEYKRAGGGSVANEWKQYPLPDLEELPLPDNSITPSGPPKGKESMTIQRTKKRDDSKYVTRQTVRNREKREIGKTAIPDDESARRKRSQKKNAQTNPWVLFMGIMKLRYNHSVGGTANATAMRLWYTWATIRNLNDGGPIMEIPSCENMERLCQRELFPLTWEEFKRGPANSDFNDDMYHELEQNRGLAYQITRQNRTSESRKRVAAGGERRAVGRVPCKDSGERDIDLVFNYRHLITLRNDLDELFRTQPEYAQTGLWHQQGEQLARALKIVVDGLHGYMHKHA